MADVLGGLWCFQPRRVLLRHFPLLVSLLLCLQGENRSGHSSARDTGLIGSAPDRSKSLAALCLQCLFLLWCMAPMTWNGSQIIYNKVIRPIFLRHEATVDHMVSNLGGKAMDAAENLTREGALHFLVALCSSTSSQLLFSFLFF